MRQANLQIWTLKTYFWVEEKEDEFVGRGQDNGSGDDVLMKICLAATYSTVTSALTFPWKRNLAYTKKLVGTKICKNCLKVPYAIKKFTATTSCSKKRFFTPSLSYIWQQPVTWLYPPSCSQFPWNLPLSTSFFVL